MRCAAELRMLRMLRKQKEHELDQVKSSVCTATLKKPLNSQNVFPFLSVRITLCGNALKNTCPCKESL